MSHPSSNRPVSLPERQAPTRFGFSGAARRWYGAVSSCAALTLLACSLITPLDYVGNGSTKDHPDAGEDDAGHRGDAGEDAATPAPDATTGDACGNSCNAGESCVSGVCTCPSDTLPCDGSCVASPEAAGYCGACGVTCRKDQSCLGGVCVCATGKTNCSNACAELAWDEHHCGSCSNTCSAGQRCIEGNCRSSPCDGYCVNPESLAESAGGFHVDRLGQAAHCIAVAAYVPQQTYQRIVCWNFDANRTLSVNGRAVACTNDRGVALTPQTDEGWYCIQVGAGGFDGAGFVLPTN